MALSLTGVAVGAGAALIGNAVLPVLGSALKSLAKSVVKGGLHTYHGGKGLITQTTHALGHMASEASEEVKAGAAKQATGKKAKAGSVGRKSTQTQAAQ